jgi:cysteine-rich repeat protein
MLRTMLGVRLTPLSSTRAPWTSLALLCASCGLPHAPLPGDRADARADVARTDVTRTDAIATDVPTPPLSDVIVPLPGPDASCAPPTSPCAGACVDLETDPSNCGACGLTCPRNARCNARTCECPLGESVCNNVCVNFATDPANCGGCTLACGPGQVCSGGTCGNVCAAPRRMCGMSCTDTTTDNANCGMCSNLCPSGSTCSAGACLCAAGTTLCGSACVNLDNDTRNCGACGSVCAAPTGGTATCASRTCTRACPADQTLCGATCQPRNNPASCGAGCVRCAAPVNGTVSCDGTRCVPTCNMGYRLDGSLCVMNMPPSPSTCGNRVLDMSEECEDGNTASGDGCSATCTVEPGVFTDNCSGGGALTFPLNASQTIWFRGNTAGANNDYSDCNESTGPDRVIRYRTAAAGVVSVTLMPEGRWDITLRGGDNCPGIYCNDANGAGSSEGASFGTTAGRTWFHTIDGYRGASGPFVFQVSLR